MTPLKAQQKGALTAQPHVSSYYCDLSRNFMLTSCSLSESKFLLMRIVDLKFHFLIDASCAWKGDKSLRFSRLHCG